MMYLFWKLCARFIPDQVLVRDIQTMTSMNAWHRRYSLPGSPDPYRSQLRAAEHEARRRMIERSRFDA